MRSPKRQAADASPGQAGQLTLQNRLPPRHPQRVALEAAIRSVMAGFDGRWDIVLEVPDPLSLAVAVIAPDGSSWSMSCCSPAQRDPESIAETVKAACSRRRWLNPGGASGGKARTTVAASGTPDDRTRPDAHGGKRA